MKKLLIIILFFLFDKINCQTNKLENCFQILTIKIKMDEGFGSLHSGTFINIYDSKGFLYNNYTKDNSIPFSFKIKCGENYRIEAFNQYYIIEEKNYTPSFDLEKNIISINAKKNPRFNFAPCFSASSYRDIINYDKKELKIDRESKIIINNLHSIT